MLFFLKKNAFLSLVKSIVPHLLNAKDSKKQIEKRKGNPGHAEGREGVG